MQIFQINDIENIKKTLLPHSIFFLDTDTIVGISCSAYSEVAKNQIMQLKSRSDNKIFINLVDSIDMVKKFCNLSTFQENILNLNWPNPISFILKNKITNSKMIFRCPNNLNLLKFLKIFGPLVSTSANISGKKTATVFNDISDHLKANINIYICNLENNHKDFLPSTVVDISDDNVEMIRKGSYKIIT